MTEQITHFLRNFSLVIRQFNCFLFTYFSITFLQICHVSHGSLKLLKRKILPSEIPQCLPVSTKRSVNGEWLFFKVKQLNELLTNTNQKIHYIYCCDNKIQRLAKSHRQVKRLLKLSAFMLFWFALHYDYADMHLN